MACARMIQLARMAAGPQESWIRAAALQCSTQWWRSMSSSFSAMETCRTSQSSFEQEFTVANAVVSSGDSGVDAILCGRGDKKTKRGKRFKHSFGNPRESRGTTTRRLRKKWGLSYDPLVPIHTQPFPLFSPEDLGFDLNLSLGAESPPLASVSGNCVLVQIFPSEN